MSTLPTELMMMEAAAFQLKVAVDSVEDPFTRTQIRLAANMLATAIENARQNLNAASVSDIDFALSDIEAGANDLPAAEAEAIHAAIAMIRGDLETVRAKTALSPELVASIHAFEAKLRERRSAIERQTYVEGGGGVLPHDPMALRDEVLPIRDSLAGSGYRTPAIDEFVNDPAELRFHSITAMLDELEVIVGA